MTKSTRTLGIISGVGLGLLTLGLASSSWAADRSRTMSQTKTETVTVTGVDRSARTATLTNANGRTETVDVPSDVQGFDTLKVGDKIDLDYYQAVAVSMLPKGATPSVSSRSETARMGQGMGGVHGRETTVSAEVVSVDTKDNTVTFRGPSGNEETVAVSAPALQKKLSRVKPGQVMQVTYTEAIAASIRPSSSSSKGQQQ